MPEISEVYCQAAALAHILDVPLTSSIDVDPDMAHLPVWGDCVFRAEPGRLWQYRHLDGERPDFVWHAGKVMRLEFKGIPQALQFRFGMTGWLSLENSPWTRETFIFVNHEGHFLQYVDPRKFGNVSVVDRGEPLITGLDAYTMRPVQLQEVCQKSRRKIRDLLTDQKTVAGIGNYLVNEVLWTARIHPYRPANTLDKAQVWYLTEVIQATIAASVLCGGATLATYFGLDGQRGTFSDRFQVYRKEKCSRCGSAITRLKSPGTRSSYVCLECQKL